MSQTPPIRVMFVCTGNICRSPMAEAIFRHLVDEAGLSDHIEIASSGTGSWHAGERPHKGTRDILKRNNIPEGNMRAQQIRPADLEHYDYVLVADADHLHELEAMRVQPRGDVRRLMEFAPESPTMNIPDPYYTGNFQYVYELITEASQGLLRHIREKESL